MPGLGWKNQFMWPRRTSSLFGISGAQKEIRAIPRRRTSGSGAFATERRSRSKNFPSHLNLVEGIKQLFGETTRPAIVINVANWTLRWAVSSAEVPRNKTSSRYTQTQKDRSRKGKNLLVTKNSPAGTIRYVELSPVPYSNQKAMTYSTPRHAEDRKPIIRQFQAPVKVSEVKCSTPKGPVVTAKEKTNVPYGWEGESGHRVRRK